MRGGIRVCDFYHPARDADLASGGTAAGGLAAQPPGEVMKVLLTRFVKEEHGSTALEYGLIAAGLSIAIVTVLTQVALTLGRLKASAASAGN
ncbi:hypothetical protein GCM10007301_24800 [Azorhizobium oxalatiphilum]|uniref:Flp family type IVb pilin n=2 Tax=Azorhizobium oxalatiphilum TaxID=980631 RepID=A0A917C0E3_9HYPH|nr:hypothetical protein GCM10007301_24800 [Azorhizobium oxalatiphilum]